MPELSPLPQPELATPLAEPKLVGLVCSPQEADGGKDFPVFAEACAAQHIELQPVVWSDPSVDWRRYTALLPLRVWDYSLRASSFRHWLAERERERAYLINSPQLLHWNMDKSYLLALQEEGVPMSRIEMRWPGGRRPRYWPPETELVCKPRRGAGAFGLERVPPHSWPDFESDMLAQEYHHAIVEHGEIAVVCVEGKPCGQVRRRAAHDDFRVQEMWGGSVQPEPLDEAAAQLALEVLEFLPEPPLYARLDLWDWQRPPLLVELELLEPDLFLRCLPETTELLAAGLARRLTGRE